MRRIEYILLFVLGSLVAAGCYEDKGNYDYHEVNEVKIDSFPKGMMYAYNNVDTIRVHPTLSGTLLKDDLSNYTYRWEAVVLDGKVDDKTSFVIDSNRLELEYPVTLPVADYTVYLHVYDKTTGVTWKRGFDLKVTSAKYEGWLILSDVDGRCRMDMVSTSTEEEIINRDIWKGTYLSECTGPNRLSIMFDIFHRNDPPVYVSTDQGMFRLDNSELGYDPINNLKYEFGKWNPDFEPEYIKGTYGNQWRICVGRQGIFVKKAMDRGALFGLPANRVEGEEEFFEVAPYVGMHKDPYAYNPAIVFYDMTNRRFVQLSRSLQGVRIPTAPEKYFKWNTGKEFVFMMGTQHDRGELYTILKDGAGKLWLYGIRLNSMFQIGQVEGHHFQLDAPEIGNATAFAVHPVLPYLFYAVGDRIYQFDINTRKCRLYTMEKEDGKIIDHLEGEKITYLNFNMFICGNRSKPREYRAYEQHLIIGSEETGGSGRLKGHVRMESVPAVFGESGVILKSYKGFGSIRDVLYRERK